MTAQAQLAEAPPHASTSLITRRDFQQVIKYMGSKAGIIDFVIEGLNLAYKGGVVCDLFAGACTLPGAIGHCVPMLVNDIQVYSSVIAHVYLHRISEKAFLLRAEDIFHRATPFAEELRRQLPSGLSYPANPTLAQFNIIDEKNRDLIDSEFHGSHHLFTKYYSGTWWSVEQCIWIDSLKKAIDLYLSDGSIERGDYCILLTCMMHAMAYCGQGTGHYAQYRDAKNKSSLTDINIYRQKSIPEYFMRKWSAIKKWNTSNVLASNHKFLSDDYKECLKNINESTVYADPPYAFVHYSRFYHAIETFVLYDYPELQIKSGSLVKGRYREGRHQSPFSIRSLVPSAFEALFQGIDNSGSNLVLSYSNTGLFKLPEMFELADAFLGTRYDISALTTDHLHMTMGRREDRNREVEEALLIAIRHPQKASSKSRHTKSKDLHQ